MAGLNVDRAEIAFLRMNHENRIPLVSHSPIIKKVGSYGYLGSIITRDLEQEKMLNTASSKASAGFGQLIAIFTYIQENKKAYFQVQKIVLAF